MQPSSHAGESLSATLLVRLRSGDDEAWRRLTRIFTPLVYGWSRRSGLKASDAADVTQEVFQKVARSLSRFRRDEANSSFRAWLNVIWRNALRDFLRRSSRHASAVGGSDMHAFLQALPEELSESSVDSRVPGERQEIVRRTLAALEVDFEPATWSAFWLTTVEEVASADAAERLGLSVNAVYKAKSRILRRLRDELDGLTG